MRAYHSLIFMALFALATPTGNFAAADPAPALITVTGEGQAEAAPDMATISLGVTTTAATAKAAMAENAGQLAIVLGNLKAAGIEPRDLQTSGLSLGPNWSNSETGSKIDGYTAANQLSVRVRNLDRLGEILDAAVKDGANTLNGVQFGLTDPSSQLDEARKRAVADARHRAALLAEAAGSALGTVVSITEGGNISPAPQFKSYGRAAMESMPVEAGELALSASVTVIWHLTQ
jgi:uncharacterized protein YggE